MQSKLEVLMARVTEAEECISELEDGLIEKKTKIEAGLKKIHAQGRLGGTVVKRLPSAQGMILAFWDRAPHQAPLLWACFFLSHSPWLCSLSCWLSLSLSKNKILKKKGTEDMPLTVVLVAML